MSSEEDQRNIELAEVQNVLNMSQGRKLLYRILELTRVEYNTFDINPIFHAKNAGKREVGLWLRDELKESSPELYQLMLKENDG